MDVHPSMVSDSLPKLDDLLKTHGLSRLPGDIRHFGSTLTVPYNSHSLQSQKEVADLVDADIYSVGIILDPIDSTVGVSLASEIYSCMDNEPLSALTFAVNIIKDIVPFFENNDSYKI